MMYDIVLVTQDKKLDFLKLTDGQLNLLEYLKAEGYLSPDVAFGYKTDGEIKFSMVQEIE